MEAMTRRLLRPSGVSIGLAAAMGWAAWKTGAAAQVGPLRFEVSVPASAGSQPIDGRVLLMLSTGSSGEPRFQINDGVKTQQVFGVDVEGLASGNLHSAPRQLTIDPKRGGTVRLVLDQRPPSGLPTSPVPASRPSSGTARPR